jgi:hypothetical protein
MKQNEQTHDILIAMRADLKAHYSEDAAAWKKLDRIETTVANAGYAFGAVVAVVGIVIGIMQMVK